MTEPPTQRRLAAILAADIVGYSRLMGLDESGTLTRLKALRHGIIEPAIVGHRGRIVKLMGDGTLVEFASVVDAVACAVQIQSAIAGLNAQGSEDSRIELRIGINVGDVIVDDGDLYGDGVNVAARIEALATPGAICIADSAYQQIKGKVPLDIRDLGSHQLKNIAEPVRLYEIGLDAAPVRPILALPDRPSIAVLPFQNMSGDPEQDYFADGMVEEIITGLSRLKWLFVIARNSCFTYKGRAVDVRQIARELGVRYVLEGSVRKAGNRVRISSQLVEAKTGLHLWADRYDRPVDDIFAMQDEITINVIGAIEPSLRKAEIERVKRKRPDSLHAYDLVLRALPLAYNMMPEEAERAIPLLQQALAIDPDYASAHGFLAWCFHFRYSRGGLHDEDRAASIDHARAAMRTGGDDATALALAGLVISFDQHDHDAALILFDRALALSASNIFGLCCSAVVMAWMGRMDLAGERAQRALRLSPFDSLNYLAYDALAIVHFYAGRYGEAAEAARRAIETNPRFSVPYALLAAALIRLGQASEASAAARQVLAVQPTFSIRGLSATVGHSAAVYQPFADAFRDAGLPDS